MPFLVHYGPYCSCRPSEKIMSYNHFFGHPYIQQAMIPLINVQNHVHLLTASGKTLWCLHYFVHPQNELVHIAPALPHHH